MCRDDEPCSDHRETRHRHSFSRYYLPAYPLVFSLTGIETSCFGGSLLPTPPDNAPLSNPFLILFITPFPTQSYLFFTTRFGFHNASTIDSLLDKEDVALEAILDEDDLIQECKAQNTRLIDYFGRVDVLHKLLGYVTGQIESEEKGKFKSVPSNAFTVHY
jgi:hypothetical protein